MKLKDWADKQGISYLTAWRWFKARDPRLSTAYQSDSGTIIVPDEFDSLELSMNNIQDSDVMAVVLKKTVEFSRNEYAIEDFTAWLLSNFTLKVKGLVDAPKYSKVKPKSEEIQKHFQQFLKPKGEKPKTNVYLIPEGDIENLVEESDSLSTEELVNEIYSVAAIEGVTVDASEAPEVKDLMKEISCAIATPKNFSGDAVASYNDIAKGVIKRSVDSNSEQHFNYTDSVDPAFSNLSNSFKPTKKELESADKISDIIDIPKRRRKSLKNKGNE